MILPLEERSKYVLDYKGKTEEDKKVDEIYATAGIKRPTVSLLGLELLEGQCVLLCEWSNDHIQRAVKYDERELLDMIYRLGNEGWFYNQAKDVEKE